MKLVNLMELAFHWKERRGIQCLNGNLMQQFIGNPVVKCCFLKCVIHMRKRRR